MIQIIPIRDPGLANTSHVVDLGDGSALVVDPERDPRPYLEVADKHGLVIRHVAETHLHADFVSGGRELVAQGASLIAPRQSGLTHPHQGVSEGEELAVGDLTIAVLETPGHTPEHVAYLLKEGSRPRVLFSGGTLMTGGVARPDLVSPELTLPLARQAYRSVQHMLESLPGDVEVRPTHGAGSFCASGEAALAGVSTVAAERLSHPVSTAIDEDDFVDNLVRGLGTYPSYFLRLREVNRAGPEVYGVDLPDLSTLQPGDLEGHTVVDVRPIDRFSAGHIPGSVSIALRDQFGTWLGWLVTPDTPVIFVIDSDQDGREVVRQALNVGHENIAGRIKIAEWTADGGEQATIDLVDADEIDPAASILDVRQDSEWVGGHVPDALHVELAQLGNGAAGVEPGSVVHCGHGLRAMTAASLLARAGSPAAAVTAAGHQQIRRPPVAS